MPIELQLKLLLKTADFDRNFDDRTGDEVVLAVLYQKKLRPSVKVKDAVMSYIDDNDITSLRKRSLKVISFEYDSPALLDTALSRHCVDMLFVAPIRGVRWDEIISVTQKKHVLTYASVSEYVESGISVGFGLKDERPQIVINHASSLAEGAEFSSQLLALSKVYNRNSPKQEED